MRTKCNCRNDDLNIQNSSIVPTLWTPKNCGHAMRKQFFSSSVRVTANNWWRWRLFINSTKTKMKLSKFMRSALSIYTIVVWTHTRAQAHTFLVRCYRRYYGFNDYLLSNNPKRRIDTVKRWTLYSCFNSYFTITVQSSRFHPADNGISNDWGSKRHIGVTHNKMYICNRNQSIGPNKSVDAGEQRPQKPIRKRQDSWTFRFVYLLVVTCDTSVPTWMMIGRRSSHKICRAIQYTETRMWSNHSESPCHRCAYIFRHRFRSLLFRGYASHAFNEKQNTLHSCSPAS